MHNFLPVLLLASVHTKKTTDTTAETACTQQWVEPKRQHVFGRCDIDELGPDELTAALFTQSYSLRRPAIVRNTSLNGAARQFLADRCRIMRDYGAVSVDVGAPMYRPHIARTLTLAQATRSRSRYMGGQAHRRPSASIWRHRLTPRRRGTSSTAWAAGESSVSWVLRGGLLT